MSDALSRRLLAFLADEDGATATSWLYAGLLLLILAGVTQDQWSRQWDRLRISLGHDTTLGSFFLRD